MSFKLFALLERTDDVASLARAKEQERTLVSGKAVVQIAKYLHGVGDSSNKVIRILGGAFGTGIIARIVRGYTFISRNYQDGDSIFIGGFSRGAYTARSLAGLIVSKGLLQPPVLLSPIQGRLSLRNPISRPYPRSLALRPGDSHLPSRKACR